jgi:hypothetical protein
MKKRSIKFWLIFWLISGLFLIGWFFYWQTRFGGFGLFRSAIDYIPASEETREDYKTLLSIADYLMKDGEEKTFLVLFQNNLEIRPGGGFIGSFGILKVKNGKVMSLETHDLSNFDARIPDGIKPPYPMEETLRIKSWKLRDSNFSPDFETNALKADEFYRLGKGEEQFDGVIGITANVLTSMLKVTGPIQIEGYPGTYEDENAIIALEYQVEKAFDEQGIERGDRKNIMNDIAKVIIQRVMELGAADKLKLGNIILEDLKKKDIQLYFNGQELQKIVKENEWSGNVDKNWKKDYLMLVDANLGAYKSDYYVKRSVDYSVDLSGEKPVAKLKITYNHTAREKDFMTKDYITYLRVYVPDGAWFESGVNFGNPKFGNELGKKYFGSIVKVPLGQSVTVELNYILPSELKNDYDLLVQKQPGINDVPVKATVDGRQFDIVLNSDTLLSSLKN